MSEQASIPERPFVGLIPFREEDARYFFGREKEQEIITANLLASRLTLLYGASGVGKSSVLRAGVAHRLRQLAAQHMERRGRPKFVVAVFNSWSDDPLRGTLERIEESAAQLFQGQQFEPLPETLSFVEKLQEWSRRVQGQLLVIYDQFEEYFLYRANEQGEGTFATEFPRAVNLLGLSVNFLVSYREDAHAKLDFFKGSIPQLFENYFRIEHLDAGAARAAIVRPVEEYNRQRAAGGASPVQIEPELVGEVLKQVEAGQVTLGEEGRGIVKNDSTKTHIETPYLQLALTRLWDEEMHEGSRVLRLETLKRLGGAKNIVRTHLDTTMSGLSHAEQDGAAEAFRYLVTPSGTKIAYTASDLSQMAGIPEEETKHILKRLAGDARILRAVAPPADQLDAPVRYEIFHDVLARAVLDWRARYVLAREQKRALARARKQRLGIISGAIVLSLAAVVGVYVYQQRRVNEAEKDAAEISKEARSVTASVTERYDDALVYVQQLTSDDAIVRKQAVEGITELAERKQLPAEMVPTIGAIIEKREGTEEAHLFREAIQAKLARPTPTPQDAQQNQQQAVQQTAQTPPRIYIHIRDEKQRQAARDTSTQLEKRGFVVEGIENVGARGPTDTELRCFRQSDVAQAKEIVRVLGEVGAKAKWIIVPGFENSKLVRPNQYELWFELPYDKREWFVLLGSFPKDERAKAEARLSALQQGGYKDARLVNWDEYSKSPPHNLLALIRGPYSKEEAKRIETEMRRRVPDAYAIAPLSERRRFKE
ncbi:MAG TPA: hypothetical protein VNA19_11495 [Pyrinomonadaceae bacterium]|jgi:hypothetical protein|nr:hypothetical protein [Pyrinomonadaceae bacterium]